MEQNSSISLLKHIARAILISTHEVFVRPHTSSYKGKDSVATKKLPEIEVIW